MRKRTYIYSRRWRRFAFALYLVLASSSLVGLIGIVSAQTEPRIRINLPRKVIGGGTVTGTIELPDIAPSQGLLVTLTTSDASIAKVEPQNQQLKAGEKSLTFALQTQSVVVAKDILIKAAVGDQQLGSTLRVHPLLVITPSEIPGGRSLSGKLELPDKAPSAGVIFNLTSNSSIVTFDPQQVTVRPGQDEATFKILTTPVSVTNLVDITAEGGGLWARARLNVVYDWKRLAGAIISGVIVTGLAFFVLPYVWRIIKRLLGKADIGIGRATRGINDGDDGVPSTSIFQNYIWTAIIIYAYSSLAYIKLWWLGGSNNLTITRNIIIVMGASISTRVLARAITANKVREGRVVKMSPPTANTYLREKREKGWPALFKYIFTDDGGNPELGKIQVMAWTFIAVGIFLIDWHSNVMLKNATDMNLPTIDDALVVLMGLSAGGYLGTKLIKEERPILINADPPKPKKGTIFRINGAGFTNTKGSVLVDGQVLDKWSIKVWQDSFVNIEIPIDAKPGRYSISVIANGQPSTNAVDVEVTD